MDRSTLSGVLHLVRHGRVENPRGVIYGRLPGYLLSETGRRQADAAAEHLATRPVAVIRTSPLERARETAAAIAARVELEPVVDHRLIESETTLEGAVVTLGRFLASPRSWWRLRNPWRPSWGESFAEVRTRMMEAVGEALAEAAGGEAVLVSHQTPLLVVRVTLGGRRVPPWLSRLPCRTGSVTTLRLEQGRTIAATYFDPPSDGVHRRW